MVAGETDKYFAMEGSRATISGQCVGGANQIGRFRLASPSSLADGASGIDVLHLIKSAQSCLKIPQADRIPSMRSAYLTYSGRVLQ